jgi:uncharacterized protein YciI
LKYLVMTLRTPDFRDEVLPRHYAFLADLRASGKLEGSGPFTDRSGGAYLLRADSLEEARRIADNDPLHRENCSKVTVREWDMR